MSLSLILHPLDYSGGAKPVLARALALAKWHDADLHVRHVRSRRRGLDDEKAAHARLREFVDARNPDRVKFETVILAGDPVATASRAPALDWDICSTVAGRASQANPIGGLVSW